MIKDALTLNFSKKWFCGECNSGNHTILIILRWLKAPYFPYLLENILNYQNYLWPVYLLGTKTGAMVNFLWRWLFFSNNGMAMVFENSHHHHRWFLAGSTIGSDGFSNFGDQWFTMVTRKEQLIMRFCTHNFAAKCA